MNPINDEPQSGKTTIHPVILAVAQSDRRLKGRDKVALLKKRAREALSQSAYLSGVRLGLLEKDTNGAPLPCNGMYWSLTHKEEYVAAVTAPFAMGIDIEKLKPVRDALYQRLANEQEWQLAPVFSTALFFRYWTAKEAVLKAVGVGFTGLSRCRVDRIVDEDHLIVYYEDSMWTVTHYWRTCHHIVSVAANHVEIKWHQID